MAGSPRHPDWYYNVLAHPAVDVEVGDERFSATAVVVTGPVRDRLCGLHPANNLGWGKYLS